jgi:ubiquinone/menaquinone biosynthesis C-methylase UbiE
MIRKPICTACALVLLVVSSAIAQLASRPAEEWRKTLDQPGRVEGLRIDEVISKLGVKPGLVVADLGAGTGIFSAPLAKAVAPGGRVYAVEVDKAFLPMIEGRAKDGGIANIRPVLGEFSDPKLPAQDVDLAFMHDVLHHVQDRAGYLKAAGRYVKANGRFAIIDYRAEQSPHRDEPALIVSEEQVASWMKSAGFGRMERVEIFKEKYVLVFSR